MRIRLALAAALFLTVPALRAENPLSNRGIDLAGVFQVKDVDIINVFNGSLIVDVPMATQFGLDGGFSYRIHLIYNGQPWDFVREQRWILDPDKKNPDPQFIQVTKAVPAPNRRSNAGIGWRVTMGHLVAPNDPTNNACTSVMSDVVTCARWTYESPDGSNHVFYDTGDGTSSLTHDGSHLRLIHDTTRLEVQFPDGMTHCFNSDGTLSKIFTPFDLVSSSRGPSVTVDYLMNDSTNPCGDSAATTCWRVADRFQRQQFVTFYPTQNLATGQLAHIIRVTAPGGNTVSYTLAYNSAATYDPATDPAVMFDSMSCYDRWDTPDSIVAPILTKIALPDGSSYDFATYNQNPPDCMQASMQSMTLPTKATINYDYADFVPGNKANSDPPQVAGVYHRTATDPAGGSAKVWTYEHATGDLYSQCSGCGVIDRRELAVTVTDPEGWRVRHFFSIAHLVGTNQDPPGWQPSERGLPFTRSIVDTATHAAGAARRADPISNETRYLSTQVLDANGKVVRQTWVTYEGESGEGRDRDWREIASLTTYGDNTDTSNDSGRWSSVVRSWYDGFGHYKKVVTDGNFHLRDLSNGTALPVDPQSRDRRTEYTHYSTATPGVNAPWILGTYDCKVAVEGSHAKKSEFCFDAGTGFLQRARVLADDGALSLTTDTGPDSFTRGGNDLVTAYEQESTGSGNVTAELSYGGDTTSYCTPGGSAVGTGSLCSLTLPSPRYEIHHTYDEGVRQTSTYYSNGQPMPFRILDRTIDSSGAVANDRDSAQVQTTFTPYSSNPLLTGSISRPGYAPLNYSYTNAVAAPFSPAEVHATESDRSSRVQYDAFGRVRTEYQTIDGREAARQSSYDFANRKTAESMWVFADTSGHYDFTKATVYQYDLLGRPLSVTAPDGKVVSTAYTGDAERDTTAQINAPSGSKSVTTAEFYDRYGRLIEIHEPNGTKTTYDYGIGGALTHVCMNVAANGSCGQERFFVYDDRGFLVSETHPENGTIDYTYDARGHVLTKRYRAAQTTFDLNYCYDDAERLLRLDSRNPYNMAQFRTTKAFTFGSANDGSNLKLGKPETAARHNFHPAAGDIVVTETYGYNDVAGRLTDKTISMRDITDPPGSQNIQTLLQHVDYNDLGLPMSVAYPTCSQVPCGAAPWGTLMNSYANGLLSAVPGFASSITHHPSGMTNTVTHSNNVLDTYSIDTGTMMPRPSAITFGSYSSCSLPQITTNLSSPPPIASGTSTTLSITAIGSALTYQWFSASGAAIAGKTSSTLDTGALTYTTSYYVRVTNPCGTVTSATATVTIATPPSITVQPSDTPAAGGTSAHLTVTATGSAPLHYHWYQGASGVVTAPVGNDQAFFDTPSLTATTQYWVAVSNVAGSVNSNTATVTVTNPPPAPAGLVATMSSTTSVDLAWQASAGAASYQIWRRESGYNFRQVGTANGTAFTNGGLTPGAAYVYQVYAVNSGGTSGPSNSDIATTMTYATITPRVTVVTFSQFEELRAAVNAVRAVSGGAPVQWTDILQGSPAPPAPAQNVRIYAEHILALRRTMDQARAALGLPTPSYTDPNLNSTVAIKATHITELRSRAQ